ncbi:solute carrier family 2, facilitated glucose transporter member 6 isoform X1 [Lepeophtheirus salmonis]|uniref:solute carrier family 2, facilitated glucose transporter member 6 isoform X1 n=1 Tax=Lepeophtheirus salmonis TaxID=72036 RepID=UPI001AE36138|nr:solute carrier family 2, facilitated glucose transporter member 6-like isoform X1 [Lepeophtheirus salmonis]
MFGSRIEELEHVETCLFKGKVGRQICVSFIANLMQSMEGVVVAMSSIMVPQLMNSTDENEISLTESQATWFASIYTIGFLSGSFIGAFQGHYFGQRVSLILDSVVSTIGLLLIGLSPSYELLLVGRLLSGHASASGTVTIPIYTSEISHPLVRGITGSFLLTFYFIGYSVTTFLGSIFPWRTTILSLSTIPLFTGVFLFMSPDSPVWLLRKGKENKAFKSLMYFLGDESKVLEEMKNIQDNFLKQKIEHPSQTVKFKDKLMGKVKRFKSPEFYKPLIICILLTSVFIEWNGIGAISVYMVTFVESLKIPMDPYLIATISSIIITLCSVLSAGVIAKFPRRKVYLLSGIGMAIGTSIVSLYHYLLENNYINEWGLENSTSVRWIPLIGYLIFSICYSTGYIQISYMAQGEMFPSDLRSFGSGLVGFIDGLSLFGAAKNALFILESMGVPLYFAYSTLIILISIVVSYFFLPETHGRSLTEIENNFRCSSKKDEQ